MNIQGLKGQIEGLRQELIKTKQLLSDNIFDAICCLFIMIFLPAMILPIIHLVSWGTTNIVGVILGAIMFLCALVFLVIVACRGLNNAIKIGRIKKDINDKELEILEIQKSLPKND